MDKEVEQKTDFLERLAHRNRQLIYALFPWMALALAITAVAGLFTILQQVQLDRQGNRLEAQGARIETASIAACMRLQIVRDRQNVSDARQYLVLMSASKNANSTSTVREYYQSLARSTTYGPPTDCTDAQSHPVGYRPPPAVPLDDLGIEFASKLVDRALKNAERAKAGKVPLPYPTP